MSAVYEGWSSMQSLDITNVNMTIEMIEAVGEMQKLPTTSLCLPTLKMPIPFV